MSERRIRELRYKQSLADRRYKRSFSIGPVTIGLISLFFLASLGIFYLTQTNRMATKGYDQADLSLQTKELTDEREQLEVEAARLQSVTKIQASLNSKMVKNDKAKYVRTPSKVAER